MRFMSLVFVALLFFTYMPFGVGAASSPYPPAWWEPIPRDQAESWEILPQDAGPGEVILSKRNELGILSNFAPTPFEYRGARYASVEGFWQMMKYPEGPADPRALFTGLVWPHTRAEVAAMTALEAKRAGELANENMRRMGIRWISFEWEHFEYKGEGQARHYELILGAMRAKVAQNPEVAHILRATGELILKPDHRQEGSVTPAYRYYEILMKIRAELGTSVIP